MPQEQRTQNSALHRFDFYGFNVLVESDDPDILSSAEHDFSYFLSSSAGTGRDFRISHHSRKPDYEKIPDLCSSFATPRNICFKSGEVTYIDYGGRAISVYDPKKRVCSIYSDDKGLSREIVYLSVLSHVASALDKERIHRIHALGLEYRGTGVLLLLPCGGGKTTLALQILRDKENGINLLSDDSPLLTSRGSLLPFPLRIGAGYGHDLSMFKPRFIKRLERMEFPGKLTVDVRCFQERVCRGEIKTGLLLLGVRSTGVTPYIRPASKIAVFKYCLMSSVIGFGLYQGAEFIMQKRLSDILSGVRVLASRMYNNFRMIMRARVYVFVIGRDHANNVSVLSDFLKRS